MNPVGRLCICVAGGVALLSVAARGDTTPYSNVNVKTLHPATAMMNKAAIMEKLHRHTPTMQHAAPGLPQFGTTRPTPHANAVVARPNIAPAPAPSESGSSSGNPYESIVTRNVFGLNPIPPPTVVTTPEGPPPPKITLTGITTIFGPAEALFKVAGVVRRGAPAHDESYIFTEGEMQDDVQVTKIDTKKNIVTFMNHGVEQEIPLTDNGVATTGSAPSQPSWPGQSGGRKLGRRFGAFGNPGGVPAPAYGNPYGGGNNGSSYNPSGAINSYGQPSNIHNTSYAPPTISQLSAEDQDALVAAAHAQAMQQGDPTAAIFPPTQFDQQAQSEAGGTGNPQNPAGSQVPNRGYYPRGR